MPQPSFMPAGMPQNAAKPFASAPKGGVQYSDDLLKRYRDMYAQGAIPQGSPIDAQLQGAFAGTQGDWKTQNQLRQKLIQAQEARKQQEAKANADKTGQTPMPPSDAAAAWLRM